MVNYLNRIDSPPWRRDLIRPHIFYPYTTNIANASIGIHLGVPSNVNDFFYCSHPPSFLSIQPMFFSHYLSCTYRTYRTQLFDVINNFQDEIMSLAYMCIYDIMWITVVASSSFYDTFYTYLIFPLCMPKILFLWRIHHIYTDTQTQTHADIFPHNTIH